METNEDYYISRNALLEHFEAHVQAHKVGEIERDIWFAAYEDVDNFDLADVAPVVHAKWNNRPIYKFNSKGKLIKYCDMYYCSACKIDRPIVQPYNFCPNCGALMDEGDK